MTPPDTNSTPFGGRPRTGCGLRSPSRPIRLWLEPLRAVGADGDTLYLTGPGGDPGLGRAALLVPDRRSAGRLPAPPLQRVSFAAAARAEDGGGRRRGRAEPQLHLRPLRHRPRQPARPRRRAGRRRGALGGLQPALPPRPSRARQDPPAGGDRQLPAAPTPPASASATRPPSRSPTSSSRALKSAGAEAFKARYRDIDVLLIDDVQFLEGKPATEEEFFHTFNALYESGSQLVLSADRIPSELSTLASRLRDRFEWGLTVAGRAAQPGHPADRPAPPGRRRPGSRSPTPTRSPSSPTGSTPTSASCTAP